MAKKSELKTLLFAELKNQGDPRILGKGDIFDNYEYADSVTTNFYERFKKRRSDESRLGKSRRL